jgi:hypothetical protein
MQSAKNGLIQLERGVDESALTSPRLAGLAGLPTAANLTSFQVRQRCHPLTRYHDDQVRQLLAIKPVVNDPYTNSSRYLILLSRQGKVVGPSP